MRHFLDFRRTSTAMCKNSTSTQLMSLFISSLNTLQPEKYSKTNLSLFFNSSPELVLEIYRLFVVFLAVIIMNISVEIHPRALLAFLHRVFFFNVAITVIK